MRKVSHLVRTTIKPISWFLFVLLFYLFIDSYFSLFLLTISFIILFYLVFSTKMYRKNVQFDIVAPKMMNKNERGECYIEAKNHTIWPISKVKCTVEIHHLLTGEVKKQDVFFSLNSKTTERIYLQIENQYCGTVKLCMEKATCYDFLSVFSTTIDLKVNTSICMLPEIFEIDMLLLEEKSTQMSTSMLASNQAGANSQELISIKEYIPGDNVKQIHWKLSSKLGDLYVKELSNPVDEAIFVFLETNITTQVSLGVLDSLLESFVSVSNSLLKRNYPHYLGWYDSSLSTMRVEAVSSVNHLMSLTESLMQIEMKVQKELPVLGTIPPCSHLVYITTEMGDFKTKMKNQSIHVTMLHCQESSTDQEKAVNKSGVVVFTPEGMKEDLHQLII
ncbi:DUF58 domain-containing protein [Bacillus sp. AGMB 02131]|uniref:DUF58 domain-containing protein n=1 Tax=Peribacillus faecalis TaxID=2772559 RepID=A0A927H9Z2_9BACI|nr:DUF58 domain-containing protein [Peribacillus faecalis]MBD3107394.1 DUF58 domain-containing protein [Peribacillus faecalis]